MSNHIKVKFDTLCLGVLAGLCVLIGIQQMRKMALVNKDAVFYIGQAQKLPADCADVARTYPMGYPFILWAAHKAVLAFVGHDSAMLWLHSGQGVTLLCRMLALIPLYFIGKLLVGARNSFWALLILLVLPYPAQFASEVLREWPHVLFLGLGFWLLCWGLRRRQWWLFALVGLDPGLAYLIRPENIQLVLYAFLGLVSLGLVCRENENPPLDALGRGVFCPRVVSSCRFHPSYLRHGHASGRPQFQAAFPYGAAHHQCDRFQGTLPMTRWSSKSPEGELLELPVQSWSTPHGGPMTFSLARVPVGSRPVYRILVRRTRGDFFWTLQANERDHLLSETLSRRVWNYEEHRRITPIHRAGRPVRIARRPPVLVADPAAAFLHHGMNRRRQTILSAPTAADTWQYRGGRFSMPLAESNRPPDAVPVYRHSRVGRRGYFLGGRRARRPIEARPRERHPEGHARMVRPCGGEPPGRSKNRGRSLSLATQPRAEGRLSGQHHYRQ